MYRLDVEKNFDRVQLDSNQYANLISAGYLFEGILVKVTEMQHRLARGECHYCLSTTAGSTREALAAG